jgi:hypothetical protein
MKRTTPKPRREPERRNPTSSDQPDDARNPPVPLYGESGYESGYEDDTPTRPLPAITPAR